jgi:hypothetical protein
LSPLPVTPTLSPFPFLKSQGFFKRALLLSFHNSLKDGFDDFLGEVRDSINTLVNKGGNIMQSSLDTITSSITLIKEGASEAVDGHPILRSFFRKAWSFLRVLRWAGHLILRLFLRKAWSFLRILRWTSHPILRPFF